MSSFHTPVLLAEAVASLNVHAGGVYVDGTVGGGGHALEILKLSAPDGILIGIDLDCNALKEARKTLQPFGDRVKLVQGNYSRMAAILKSLNIERCDAILLDLGVSSHQLNAAERGFSFLRNGPLDMRLDQRSEVTAHSIINQTSKDRLETIIKNYGEEVMASRIAQAIVRKRSISPIETTSELENIIFHALPRHRRTGKINPATKTFQAIRIAVNNELDHLSTLIESAVDLLLPGGRLSIVSFHSLEDRLVKRGFAALAAACICPPKSPVCNCTGRARMRLITRRSITPSESERNANPRARSARLRTAERV